MAVGVLVGLHTVVLFVLAKRNLVALCMKCEETVKAVSCEIRVVMARITNLGSIRTTSPTGPRFDRRRYTWGQLAVLCRHTEAL